MSKKSMSVMEMGKMLGLKKTESYWLVHRGFFQTKVVGGHIRVLTESFEKWYSNQLHYKKLNGELPGKELLQRMMTVQQMASLLTISEGTAYDLLRKNHFQAVKTEYLGQRLLIDKTSFYKWLQNRTDYQIKITKEDNNV